MGTSLANIIALGKTEWALGILPIRLGYWQQILADELTTEPFIEVGYYPSSFIHIGNRVNLKLAEMMNVSFLLGYVSGNSSNAFGEDITRELGYPVSFSKPYFGISIGIVDRIFIPEELRYNK